MTKLSVYKFNCPTFENLSSVPRRAVQLDFLLSPAKGEGVTSRATKNIVTKTSNPSMFPLQGLEWELATRPTHCIRWVRTANSSTHLQAQRNFTHPTLLQKSNDFSSLPWGRVPKAGEGIINFCMSRHDRASNLPVCRHCYQRRFAC